MKRIALTLATISLLSACGTAVNGTVAAYETNIASNQVQVGKNALNAKVFALCMTPVYDLANATTQQRAAIKAGCVPATEATETGSVVDAMGNTTSTGK